MLAPKPRVATYEDVLAAPDDMTAELIDGRLRLQARPAPKHQYLAGTLQVRLGAYYGEGFGGTGGWVFIPEPEIWIGDNLLVPDLAAWRAERLPEVPGNWKAAPTPDWVCEILSPSTAWTDLHEKGPIYAAGSVSFFWVVEPRNNTLQAFQNVDGEWAAMSGPPGPSFPAEPFAGVPKPLG